MLTLLPSAGSSWMPSHIPHPKSAHVRPHVFQWNCSRACTVQLCVLLFTAGKIVPVLHALRLCAILDRNCR